MARQLTKKQKGFVKDYLETGNGVKAALNNYETDDYNTANVIAVENLQKPTIRQYLESKASRAAEVIFELATSAENETVRLGASKDIMDRAGYGAVTKSFSVALNQNVGGQNLDKTEIMALKEEYEEKLKAKLIQ